MSAAEADAMVARVDEMSQAELEAAWQRMEADWPAAQTVAARLTRIAWHRRDREAARRWLKRAGVRPELGEVVRGLDGARASKRVAVLLPLSGAHRAIGREMKQAIAMAGQEVGVELVYIDSAGTNEGAERGVEQAAHKGALAVLGPVGQGESRAAAAMAARLGVPIALLSPTVGGAAPSAGVFQLWSSPEWLASEAARLAVARGHDRLAVLAPRDESGQQHSQAFAQAARALGVQVVAIGDYDPTASDLEPDIKAFLGLDPMTNDRLRRHLRRFGRERGWKTYSPDVMFDLLYIPDEHRRASLVASYLPYFNIEVRNQDIMDTMALRRKHGGRIPSIVQLMGSAAWHHRNLLVSGGPAVDGALVVVPCQIEADAFGAASESPFADRFERSVGRAPGQVALQAYDSARLVLRAAQVALARSRPASEARAAFSAALARAQSNAGACGSATMGNSGSLERPAWLLQIDGGEFLPLDPS